MNQNYKVEFMFLIYYNDDVFWIEKKNLVNIALLQLILFQSRSLL